MDQVSSFNESGITHVWGRITLNFAQGSIPFNSNIVLQNLIFATAVELRNLNQVQDFTLALPALTEIRGDFEIVESGRILALTSENLQKVGGHLFFHQVNRLSEINFLH